MLIPSVTGSGQGEDMLIRWMTIFSTCRMMLSIWRNAFAIKPDHIADERTLAAFRSVQTLSIAACHTAGGTPQCASSAER